MSVGFRLGGPDNVSIRLLEGWPNGLLFAPGVKTSTSLTKFLIKQYFENGAALFGRESAYEMEMVREAVGSAFAGLEVSEITRIVQYYVQRTRNYAHIEGLATARIAKARIPFADHLTPTTCIGHSGRIIEVADALSRIYWMKQLAPERYGLLAFGKDFGFPPFDILCSCRLEGIIEGVDNDAGVPRKPRVTRTKWDRLNHIYFILEKRPLNEMSEEKFSELMGLMLRVSDELVDNPDPQSKLERTIGESLLAKGRLFEAVDHLQNRLSDNYDRFEFKV